MPTLFTTKVNSTALQEKLPALGVTLGIVSLFLFFWISGPLPYGNNVLGLGFEDTEFSGPKLISLSPTATKKRFGIVENQGEPGAGFRLLGLGKRQAHSWGLIADAHNSPAMDIGIGRRILDHANEYKIDNAATKLKPALDLYYVEISSAGALKQLYLENAGEITQEIKGYAGPITLGVTIDLDGHIHSLRHISSRETSSYLDMIKHSGFYQQFVGLSLDEAHQVDALSGATLSTVAMARSLSALIKKSADSPLAIYLDKDPGAFTVDARLSNSWIFHAGILAFLFVLVQLRWIKKNRFRITLTALFSIAYIGYFINNSFTYTSFLHPFMGVSLSYLMGIYAALVLLSAIWGNNGYCKYVCPYGNVQRIITRLFSGVRRSFPLSARWLERIRLALALVLVIGIFAGFRQWSGFEVFPDFFSLNILSYWFWISLVLVLLSVVYPMIWCRLLCPTGAILDTLTAWVRPLRHVACKVTPNEPVVATIRVHEILERDKV